MAFNFPDSPSVNDTYSAGDRTWVWNGTVWRDQGASIGIEDLNDVSVTSATDNQLLQYATSEWVNADLATVLTDYDTSSEVNTKIAGLVDSAPETLDTLNELAAALGDDPNFATTVTNEIASKVSKTNGTVTTASTSSTVVRNITLSTSAPTGGNDGDVWLVYTA